MGKVWTKKPWTEEENKILVEMYPDHFASEIAKILGRTKSSVYYRVLRLGLESSPEKIKRAGLVSADNPKFVATRFRKGNIPPNKGKEMTPEIYAKCAPTMFKKGQATWNHKPVGSERVNVDGYVEIKVAEPSKWRLKNRVVWEEAYGPIPEGHNVQFKDGNPLNLSLDNLYLISKADQLKTKNSYYAKYPKELQDVIRLKGAVKRAIKHRDHNEQ